MLYTELTKQFIEDYLNLYFTGSYPKFKWLSHKFYKKDSELFRRFFETNYPDIHPLSNNPDEYFYLLKYGPHDLEVCPTCGKRLSVFNSYSGKILCDNTNCNRKLSVIRNKETCMRKYGVSNVSMLKEVQKKREDTTISKYGVSNIMLCEEGLNRQNQALINKFGTANISSLPEIKEKKKNTVLKHFENYKNFVDHTLGEFCKSFGVSNCAQLDFVKEKIKETCNQKYGCNCVLSNKEVIDRIKKYWIDRYGVDNPSKVECVKQKLKDAIIYRSSLVDHAVSFLISFHENDALNELEKSLGISIMRQVLFWPYCADGYIPFYNVVIEYDEDFHDTDTYTKQSDIRKNQKIYELGNCYIYRLKDRDWMSDKVQCIEKFRDYLSHIKERYNVRFSSTKKGIMKFEQAEKINENKED